MKILLINQCFFPDVVATAQYLTDLAVSLQDSGHQVKVVTTKRGYDDCKITYAGREIWRGIEIIRLRNTGFGKGAKWRRFLDFASFGAALSWQLLQMPKFDMVVALTSPPLVSVLASLFVRLKGGRLIYWVMDLNPDQSVAAGWLPKNSALTRILENMSLFSLRQASTIIVLDRFMKDRIVKKGIEEQKIQVIPPWPQDQHVAFSAEGRARFRRKHALSDKFVVMYSGNHSPCHPLDTILSAVLGLRGQDRIAFAFVGGGSEFEKVQEFADKASLQNIICLPYQPIEELAASLSAADLHVVVMGEPFPGIVHPCKIYNILLTGAPFLYVGPMESHITDIVHRESLNGHALIAEHGAVARVEQYILKKFQEWDVRNPAKVYGSINAHSRGQMLSNFAEIVES